MAKIRLAGHHSAPIMIARGTRQGCPLSPQIVAIETLAVGISTDSDIQGVSFAEIRSLCGQFSSFNYVVANINSQRCAAVD